VTWTPPAAARRAAALALEVRATLPRSQRAGTPIGIARAVQLRDGRPISLDTARRMLAFFTRSARFETAARPSKAWQAWNLWGGTPARDALEADPMICAPCVNPRDAAKYVRGMLDDLCRRSNPPRSMPRTAEGARLMLAHAYDDAIGRARAGAFRGDKTRTAAALEDAARYAYGLGMYGPAPTVPYDLLDRMRPPADPRQPDLFARANPAPIDADDSRAAVSRTVASIDEDRNDNTAALIYDESGSSHDFSITRETTLPQLQDRIDRTFALLGNTPAVRDGLRAVLRRRALTHGEFIGDPVLTVHWTPDGLLAAAIARHKSKSPIAPAAYDLAAAPARPYDLITLDQARSNVRQIDNQIAETRQYIERLQREQTRQSARPLIASLNARLDVLSVERDRASMNVARLEGMARSAEKAAAPAPRPARTPTPPPIAEDERDPERLAAGILAAHEAAAYYRQEAASADAADNPTRADLARADAETYEAEAQDLARRLEAIDPGVAKMARNRVTDANTARFDRKVESMVTPPAAPLGVDPLAALSDLDLADQITAPSKRPSRAPPYHDALKAATAARGVTFDAAGAFALRERARLAQRLAAATPAPSPVPPLVALGAQVEAAAARADAAAIAADAVKGKRLRRAARAAADAAADEYADALRARDALSARMGDEAIEASRARGRAKKPAPAPPPPPPPRSPPHRCAPSPARRAKCSPASGRLWSRSATWPA